MRCLRPRSERRGRFRSERGAAAVEFALLFPVVLVLIFGTMEFALLLRDYVGVSNAVRDASRVASAAPRAGIVQGHQGPQPPDGEGQSFAYDASQVLSHTGTAIPTNTIVDLWVYLANSAGYPTTSADWRTNTNRTMTCLPAYCVRYAWDTVPNPTFEWRTGTWDPASINACPNDPDAMSVGVYMRVAHGGLFPSLFNTTVNLSDSSVIKFEPLRPGPGSCKP